MRDLELGRLVRAIRRRRGWRQVDAARRAGVHRSSWSRLETGQLDGLSLRTFRECLAAVEVRVELVPRWRGTQADRVLDERHARLQAAWKAQLERWSWTVVPEASFSRYGERGRIDLLAWHPGERILVVIEIKTEIANAQELIGSIDAKARLAPFVAGSYGFPRPRTVVPALFVADGSTNRGHVRRLDPLFSRLELRGRKAISWLHRPDSRVSGLLIFSDLRPAHGAHVKSLTSHRVRRLDVPTSVESPSKAIVSRPRDT